MSAATASPRTVVPMITTINATLFPFRTLTIREQTLTVDIRNWGGGPEVHVHGPLSLGRTRYTLEHTSLPRRLSLPRPGATKSAQLTAVAGDQPGPGTLARHERVLTRESASALAALRSDP